MVGTTTSTLHAPQLLREIPTYEAQALNDNLVRLVIERLVAGKSLRSISRDLHIGLDRLRMNMPALSKYINDETRELAKMWQAIEFERLERVTEALLPQLLPNAAGDPINVKAVTAYRQLVSAKLDVLTLRRALYALPEAEQADADEAAAKKALGVGRYMELAQKLVTGVVEAGVGSGETPEGDDDEDDLVDGLTTRADNSASIEDAVVLDGGDFSDADLDSTPGEWVDGKFVPYTEEAAA